MCSREVVVKMHEELERQRREREKDEAEAHRRAARERFDRLRLVLASARSTEREVSP